MPKKFYRTGGSKTHIPKNFYTKATYITLLSEKFGGSGAPVPFKTFAQPILSTLSTITYRFVFRCLGGNFTLTGLFPLKDTQYVRLDISYF
ncbi:hypothetical protein Hanom_Chr14g01273671 [Helianthus anomalus]